MWNCRVATCHGFSPAPHCSVLPPIRHKIRRQTCQLLPLFLAGNADWSHVYNTNDDLLLLCVLRDLRNLTGSKLRTVWVDETSRTNGHVALLPIFKQTLFALIYFHSFFPLLFSWSFYWNFYCFFVFFFSLQFFLVWPRINLLYFETITDFCYSSFLCPS